MLLFYLISVLVWTFLVVYFMGLVFYEMVLWFWTLNSVVVPKVVFFINFTYSNEYSYFSLMVTNSSFINANIWQACLGYIGQDKMKCLARDDFLSQLANVNLLMCECCLVGKKKTLENLFIR